MFKTVSQFKHLQFDLENKKRLKIFHYFLQFILPFHSNEFEIYLKCISDYISESESRYFFSFLSVVASERRLLLTEIKIPISITSQL